MGVKCPKCKTENTSDSEFCKKCATPLPSSKEIPVTETLETPTEELTTGSTFAGRYQIIEELGKGGMGKVYKALDTDLKEKVAIKLIKPEVAVDKKTIERFRNELKFARKIRHKNVCQMYDLNREEGTHYITMEYVHGEDLKRLIRKMGQMSAGQVISIAKQVCEGMAEAHRLGVVHRDLKPQNIMVDEDGNARIMDFGIARSLKAKGITGAGVMIGTPEYMSPEQTEAKDVDRQSDIYSMGVILYEMVTGQLPFEGDTPLSIAMKHKSEAPKDPREINAQIPEDLSRLILKCLEKEKAERHQNVEEVLSELGKIEEGIPTTERVVAKRKLITSKGITVTFSLKKFLIPALVVIALAIVAVVTWQLLPQKGAIILPSEKSSLAILYFKNDTGDEGLNHWRSAFSQWLITDLSQSKHIYVLPVDKLFSIFRKLNLLDARSYATEDLRKVAEEGGVNHIFQASLSKAGDIFRIDYSLQKADTLEILSSDYVTGTGEESFPELIDELTRKIKRNFNLSDKQIAGDIDQNVGKITTNSPEAYKYYSQAWEYYHNGDWQKAIETCEKAIALDPDFAMAYRAVANFYAYMGYFLKYEEYMKKAMELSDRVSVRERYLIQGDFYIQSERTYDMAVQAYKKLLDIYPDDYDGNYSLGLLYSGLEEWDKAIERYKMILHSSDESSALSAHVSLAWAYRSKGLLDEAKAILEDYLTNFADDGTIHFNLRMIYVSQRKFDLAIAEAEKASKLDPIFSRRASFFADEFDKAEEQYKQALQDEDPSTRGGGLSRLYAVYVHQGRYEKAESILEQGVEVAKKAGETSWESLYQLKLSDIYSKTGDYEKALKECEKAQEIAIQQEVLWVQRTVLFAKGVLYLKMNEVEKALQSADELKEFEENELNKKLIRYYYNLMGRIELERENYDKAIRYFEDALDFLPHQLGLNDDHAIFIDPLALTFYRTGDLEKAREAYERLTFLTYGRFYHGDIYAKGFHMLGKICEQKGWKGKAIDYYEKFLDLWKEADPGIAEVEDAKKRLAGLKSQ